MAQNECAPRRLAFDEQNGASGVRALVAGGTQALQHAGSYVAEGAFLPQFAVVAIFYNRQAIRSVHSYLLQFLPDACGANSSTLTAGFHAGSRKETKVRSLGQQSASDGAGIGIMRA